MTSISVSLNQLIPLKSPPEISAKLLSTVTLRIGKRKLAVATSCTRLDDSSQNTSTTQQLNLSVLRFTFGNKDSFHRYVFNVLQG